jgi:hypothetical protein
MTDQARQGIICRMAKMQEIEARAASDNDQLCEGTSSLISWMYTVLGWSPASVPIDWVEQLPHPQFAAFTVKMMLGENSERWGFPAYPKSIPNEEAEIRGPEWDAAVQRMLDLQARLETEPRNLVLKAFWSRWQCLESVMSWQKSSKLPEMDWPSMPLRNETGDAVLNAYLNGDIDFFRDIVRMMENKAGENRTSKWIKGIQVIQIAFDLCNPETGNPSREQVIQSAEKSMVNVADWSSMFSDCCLGFLKYEREPRGRPKKK